MAYQWTRLDTALVLVVVLLIVPGVFRALRSRPPASEPVPDAASESTTPSDSRSVVWAESGPLTHDTLPEALVSTPRWNSESEHMATVYAQADEMRRYAAQADPDDPFALTEEQIQAFEKAAPSLW